MNQCSKHAKCNNTVGSYECACKSGFSGDGKICNDIDECVANGGTMNQCSPNATCNNTVGSYECACKSGFSGDGKICNDIDECVADGGSMNQCSKHAKCNNTVGSYECACKSGFSGDGKICNDIDECVAKGGVMNQCSPNAKCNNTVGSYECACKSGFSGDGKTCKDIDECVAKGGVMNQCSPNAKCNNTVGSYECACKSGFSGDGKTCNDIDECTTSNLDLKHQCDAQAICTNSVGSYTCDCKQDYAGDGRTCTIKDLEEKAEELSNVAKTIVDSASPDQVVAKVDQLAGQLDQSLKPSPGNSTPDQEEKAISAKTHIRQEMVVGVQAYVKKAGIKNLQEAQKIGDALDKSTNNKAELNVISMDACVSTSVEVLKKTPKSAMTLNDLTQLSTAVSKGPANVIDALFDTPETIPLDVDMKTRMPSKEKQALSKDIMNKTNSLIRDMQQVLFSKIGTDAAFAEVASKSFGFKIGKRKNSFLKKKEAIKMGNVDATLSDGLEAEGDISFSLTTFSRNPYLYGEDSHLTNTPVLQMEVEDTAKKPPEPAIFSGRSAMQATITSELEDNDKQKVKVLLDDMPERGKVHDISLDDRHAYMRLTFTKEFVGNVTLLGQMNIQPGDVDFDFQYVIDNAILYQEVRAGCRIVTNQQGQDYSLFVYSSCFKQLGKMKLLFKLASGAIAPVTVTQGRRRLLAKGSYTVAMVMIQPRAWNPAASAWEVVDWIEVLPESTSNAVKFKSNFFGTITSGLFVPPNTIDFAAIFPNFLERVRDSPTVLATILIILFVFVILLIWTRRMDKKDFNMWVCAPLVDNHPGDQYCYRINLHTSSRIGAGTSANVFIIIIGEKGATEPRPLYDGYRQNFQRGSISSFLLKNHSFLGRPQYVFVWHDGEGAEPHWHLSHIVIEDLYRETCDYFLCAHWLSATKGDHRTNRLLRVTHEENISSVSNLFSQHSKRFLFDTNIWFSMFNRPNKSRFTRVQRLCCCTAALFLMMLSNAMWYQTGTTGSSSALHIGPLRISFRTVFIGLMSSVIILPPTMAMVEIFSRTRFHRKEINVQIRRKYPERKQARLLPWWCVFFGYILVIMAISCGVFFTFFYSLEWGGTKSNEWLSTLLISLVETVVLLQPGKMLLIALILTCILRLPSDADETVEDEFLLTDVAENVNTLEIPVARTIPDLPDDLDNCQENEATRKARAARDKKLFTIARATGIQFLYLLLLMIICSSNRGSHYYRQNTALKRAFDLKENNVIIRLADYGQLYRWLNHNVTPILYPDKYYNGLALKSYDRRFIANMDGLRVGPARLRQKRVRQGLCTWNKIVTKCASDFDTSIEESDDFLTYWRKPTTTFTKSPFVYTSAQKNDIPLYGEYATFDGGGYVAELGDSSKTALLVLSQLFKKNWIDRLTRAVFVEATIYNANVNLFSCLRIMIETPAVGGILISRTVESFRPYPYVDAWDLILLVLQIVWVLVLFYLIYVEINLARTFRWQYVTDPWTYVQLLNVMTAFAASSLYVVRIVFVIKAIEDVKNNIGEYVSFDKMIEIDESYTASLAIIAFICILQILKPLSFNFFFALLKNTLRKAFSVLACCFLFILAIWMAFGISGHFLLVRTTATFRTFPRTLWTLLGMSIGILKYPEAMGDNLGEDALVNRISFVMFMFISYMVLMNLVVTIYLEMYSAIRGSKQLKGFDRELNDHFWKRVLMLWNAFINKQPNAWSYDVPKIDAPAPIQAEESYRRGHTGSMHLDQIVRISTMIHTSMGNAFKKYSSELETVKLDVRAAKAASDDMSRKLQDTKEDLAVTKDTVTSIKKAINDALTKRKETDWLRAHPEEWTKHRYYYEDGLLALTVAAIPNEFSESYLTVERIDDPDLKHLTCPDMAGIILPVCAIHTTEDFLIEEPILVTLPVHGGGVDDRKELLLKARIYAGDEYEEFSADPVQADDQSLIGLRAAFTAVPESLAVVQIWHRDYVMIGPDGGEVVSTRDSRVKVTFPSEAFHTMCNVTLQVKFIDINESDQCGSSHVVMLTLSERAMKPVEATIPFLDPKSAVEKMKHLLIRQGARDWCDDYTTPVRSSGQVVSFQVILPRAGEVMSFFAKSGNSSLIPRTRKADPITEVYLTNLATKMGSDWERAIYALDGGLHHRAAHGLRGKWDMSDEEKGAMVLRKWLNNQQVSVDKVKLLRDAYQDINRPDLVSDLDRSAEVFRNFIDERVQDANLLKAFRAIIQSDKVTCCWRALAARLDLSDDCVSELDRREPPLSVSEKCFEVLSEWKENGKNVTLKYLRRHLSSLGCKLAANKLADFM
ncbi:uncharacterized protein LOC135492455 [Lineus longissimus]|uniref:uncharacterized protein LOC135492455 n=1 Tax=Lineus longissimus TaxID=88925 RepID=UPI00315CF8AA